MEEPDDRKFVTTMNDLIESLYSTYEAYPSYYPQPLWTDHTTVYGPTIKPWELPDVPEGHWWKRDENGVETSEDYEWIAKMKVGRVFIVTTHIGEYDPGDFFFVHSTDFLEASDCGLVGVNGRTNNSVTTINALDFIEGRVQIIDTYLEKALWEEMESNVGFDLDVANDLDR